MLVIGDGDGGGGDGGDAATGALVAGELDRAYLRSGAPLSWPKTEPSTVSDDSCARSFTLVSDAPCPPLAVHNIGRSQPLSHAAICKTSIGFASQTGICTA